MIFDPIVETAASHLTEGDATFQILDAEDKVSSKGNKMTVFKLKVKDVNLSEGTLWENIVWSLNWKIEQLLKSIGMEKEFSSGEVSSSSLVGKKGKCFIVFVKGQGAYPDKFSVKFYISDSSEENSDVSFPDDEGPASLDDEIPF